ncbi:hypothetical protein, partial [Dactylosporangium siamense]|uniref:hypothetical protein n=1 Tax=Dactylosporangium siamense TaxID=685454 RepID=UPI0019421EDB
KINNAALMAATTDVVRLTCAPMGCGASAKLRSVSSEFDAMAISHNGVSPPGMTAPTIATPSSTEGKQRTSHR